ncbi:MULTISPECIES: AMP-binding protein [Brevibacillus]|jgi:acyl-[acyl-carrier-protein]-phospholipid O-acyltransferase/long-chain-fatty-acid--[acyl-carrier-protein] ligase|uniref:AAS bifunctional protein n=1 Tax=Brevibacillus borstelensis AK1 TaxID=1300222 RepID=M8DGD4_9BACL|nr:AMP-binding protein [Brevibacillus borstelensis]EMT52507.1 AAS bifunctional protein [Brevibacillus borstelensis AK1]MBE5395246.1 AMP-binding protein [Brevibacillus borstelensis]MCC0565883.1 AMP-binding protein [Brevibacillus borstelensis]MCM3469136.1 AMP-binding protein [Brevibacillus borstelensis]MCM3559851.1 AMP-binding protein [Brevibacillus borstelensis]
MVLIYTFIKWLLMLWFRPRVHGLGKLDLSQPGIIIPNHVSLLDAVLLSFCLPSNTTFVANTEIAKKFSLFLRFRKHITVDPMNPYSIRHMIRVVKNGDSLVIFPEGRITTTGGLMKIYSGVGYLAMRTGATVYPVIIQGLERSVFSYLKGKLRIVWFPKVDITVGTPFTMHKKENVSMREQKAAGSDLILRTMQRELFQARMKQNVNMFNEALEASRIHGKKLVIAKDMTSSINYRTLFIGSYLLGDKMQNLLKGERTVGVLLPTSVGHLVTLFALFRIGVTPAILNFSLGIRSLLDCCETAGIKTVLTSRVFIEKGKLQHLIDGLEGRVHIVYLEDVKASATTGNKLSALVSYLTGKRSKAETNELILFTSGSESKPKGVVLTHTNLYANIMQVKSVIDLTNQDKILNALPMFHSFGLTAGSMLPVIAGIPAYLYPSPLHYKVISELCYDQNITLMFGTSTFLAGYGKYAHPYNFYSLRYIFAGAEKLKPDVRQMWMDKFGVRIFEGYGATETSPILSLNTPLANKPGTVGRLLPGMEYQLEQVEGITQGGELLVKGPNVMKGYLIHGKGFIPCEEWYHTGDLVEADADGYLTIQSRLKRFAKIGGEMVSLNLVEELAAQCFGHSDFATVTISDARKGERILLYTTDETAKLDRLRAYLAEKQFSPLLLPSSIRWTKALPLLGSGKTDYVTLKQMAEKGEPA